MPCRKKESVQDVLSHLQVMDNCVGIAEEALDNVKFMTLNAEEMEQYGNVIDFSQAKQVEGTEA